MTTTSLNSSASSTAPRASSVSGQGARRRLLLEHFNADDAASYRTTCETSLGCYDTYGFLKTAPIRGFGSVQQIEWPASDSVNLQCIVIDSDVDRSASVLVWLQERRLAPRGGFVQVAVTSSTEAPDVPSAWVVEVTGLDGKGKHRSAMRAITKHTESVRLQRNYVHLDNELAMFDVKSLHHLTLLALLTNTYAIRSHLGYWTTLLTDVQNQFERRELDVQGLLFGLI
jgi:hypothetical protein